jgi:hypothetical protein
MIRNRGDQVQQSPVSTSHNRMEFSLRRLTGIISEEAKATTSAHALPKPAGTFR